MKNLKNYFEYNKTKGDICNIRYIGAGSSHRLYYHVSTFVNDYLKSKPIKNLKARTEGAIEVLESLNTPEKKKRSFSDRTMGFDKKLSFPFFDDKEDQNNHRMSHRFSVCRIYRSGKSVENYIELIQFEDDLENGRDYQYLKLRLSKNDLAAIGDAMLVIAEH